MWKNLALCARRQIKEQLKRSGGIKFYDVNFSYIDNESIAEEFVPILEQRETS